MQVRPRLKLTLLTGFLGSGKTTLLRRELGADGGAGVAVIVNEFAETGLDQDLMTGLCDACLLISGGCACCDRREDLLAALRRLLDGYERGVLGGLRRVVIETSGLADPGPIAIAIATDPVLRHHFDLEEIVAVVDGLAGAEQLAAHPEVALQIQVADRIVISKTDLASPDTISELQGLIAALSATPPTAHAHRQSVASVSLTFEQPLDWVAFGVWLSLLLHANGHELLRVKGIIEAEGLGAVAINAVQHQIYPPEHLRSPQDGQAARLVFITRNLEPESIARSLATFQGVA